MRFLFLSAIVVGLCAVGRGFSISDPARLRGYTFSEYIRDFRKSYQPGSEEYIQREGVFNDNLAKVIQHNSANASTWLMAVNGFADALPHEKAASHGYHKGLGSLSKASSPVFVFADVDTELAPLPKEVDWRKKGVLTPVKNQGACGSCWAFSTVESIEAHLAISTGTLVELSEEELVSCVPNPKHCGGSGGCAGATMELGFDYVKENGISDEWSYPYDSFTGKVPECKPRNSTRYIVGLDGFVSLPSNAYQPLLQAVANVGPISVTVDASNWHLYHGGIFDGCNQEKPDLNHGVQLVGYGEENGVAYWIVRNSWGPFWGEGGFIRIKRHTSEQVCGVDTTPLDGSGCPGGPASIKVCGTCGILYDSSYPVGVARK